MKRLLLTAIFFLATDAHAQVRFDQLQWQASLPQVNSRKTRFVDINAGSLAASLPLGSLRALLTLTNAGTKSEEGLLLRYSVEAQLQTLGAATHPIWVVPFLLEERRVPILGAKSALKVPLDIEPELKFYFKKITRAGYSIVKLKIQVTLDLRPGEAGSLQMIEKELTL